MHVCPPKGRSGLGSFLSYQPWVMSRGYREYFLDRKWWPWCAWLAVARLSYPWDSFPLSAVALFSSRLYLMRSLGQAEKPKEKSKNHNSAEKACMHFTWGLRGHFDSTGRTPDVPCSRRQICSSISQWAVSLAHQRCCLIPFGHQRTHFIYFLACNHLLKYFLKTYLGWDNSCLFPLSVIGEQP